MGLFWGPTTSKIARLKKFTLRYKPARGARRIQMLHDFANGVVMLHSNRQLRTERDGDTEKGCQKPAVHQKTTDDDDDGDFFWNTYVLEVGENPNPARMNRTGTQVLPITEPRPESKKRARTGQIQILLCKEPNRTRTQMSSFQFHQ